MKLNARYNTPVLWEWIQTRLPPSLVTKKIFIGYGTCFFIYRVGEVPNPVSRFFECTGYPVAEIHGNELSLNYPEWFSDFEDLLRQFEKETGAETTFNYWQSPKLAPATGTGEST